jgi:hypothetical protein
LVVDGVVATEDGVVYGDRLDLVRLAGTTILEWANIRRRAMWVAPVVKISVCGKSVSIRHPG